MELTEILEAFSKEVKGGRCHSSSQGTDLATLSGEMNSLRSAYSNFNFL